MKRSNGRTTNVIFHISAKKFHITVDIVTSFYEFTFTLNFITQKQIPNIVKGEMK